MDKIQLFAMLASQAPRLLQGMQSIINSGGLTGIPEIGSLNSDATLRQSFPNIATGLERGYDPSLMQQDYDSLHSLEPNYAAEIVDDYMFPDKVGDRFPSAGWKELNPNENTQSLQALYNELTDTYDNGIEMDEDATFPAMKSALRMILQNKNIGR
jgi:hypothetical protein